MCRATSGPWTPSLATKAERWLHRRRSSIVLGEHHHGLLGNLFGADVDAEVQREAGCDVILA
jgi:hypothetical protein